MVVGEKAGRGQFDVDSAQAPGTQITVLVPRASPTDVISCTRRRLKWVFDSKYYTVHTMILASDFRNVAALRFVPAPSVDTRRVESRSSELFSGSFARQQFSYMTMPPRTLI